MRFLQCSPLTVRAASAEDTPGLALLALLLLVLYLAALLRRRGKWPLHRTALFGAGAYVVVMAALPSRWMGGIGGFEAHTVQHLLVGMVAPVGLVLGAPVSLLLSLLPTGTARGVTRFLRQPVLHFFAHPVTVALISLGSLALLYFTPLYGRLMQWEAGHFLMQLHFLLVGCLFTAALIGPDPVPRVPLRLRIVVLFLSVAAHAVLSKALYAWDTPLRAVYRLDDLQAGALWMYYGGDGAEAVLIVLLLREWYRKGGAGRYHLPVID